MTNIDFEIRKFPYPPFFFTDLRKIPDIEKTIKNLPKNSHIIIREYNLDKNSREVFAKKVSALARARSLKIIVGKDFELARKIKADGIHFSDFDNLPIQFFKQKSFPKKFIFSFASHSYKSFLKAQKTKADLIFISPIFATTSHLNSPSFGINNLRKIVAKNKKPNQIIAALGGVKSDNIKILRKLKIISFGAIDLFNK